MPTARARLWRCGGLRLSLMAAVMIAVSLIGDRAVRGAAVEDGLPECLVPVGLAIDAGVLTPEETAIVREQVTWIWRRYGVAIDWRSGQAPPVPGRLSVMIRNTFPGTDGSTRAGTVAVAWIEFVPSIGPLPFVRASTDAARRVVAAMQIEDRTVATNPARSSRALGQTLVRAIAHELGHYLLASTKHADQGLMRAMIPPADFVGMNRWLFSLSREEVAALHRSRTWEACGIARNLP